MRTMRIARLFKTRVLPVPADPVSDENLTSQRSFEIPVNVERHPQIDEEDSVANYGPPQAANGSPLMVNGPLSQSNAELHFQTATRLTQIDQEPQVTEKPPAAVDIADLGVDDIVIAVMGPTGSGKSTFIHCASGHETQGVGHTLRSFTNQVLAIRFWDQESGRHVVLVDTPGFDDTSKSDLDILCMISSWLNSSYQKKKLLSGILYLHRITDNRMAGTPLKNLRVFRKLCGRDALEMVYLTTTMWDEVEPRVGERRLNELRMDYWKGMIAQGAQIARCRSDDDSPKKLIQCILAKEGTRRVRLQKEMGEMKRELKETGAGRQLYSQLEALVEKQTELLRRIDTERKAASEPGTLADLQREYDDLQGQIDDRLRQMEELKLPRLQNLLRLFSLRRD